MGFIDRLADAFQRDYSVNHPDSPAAKEDEAKFNQVPLSVKEVAAKVGETKKAQVNGTLCRLFDRGNSVSAVIIQGSEAVKNAYLDGVKTGYLCGHDAALPPVAVLPSGSFLARVRMELKHARLKHAGPIHSVAEGYAIIKEEFDEFWEEVRKQSYAQNKEDFLLELVQTAAMCARTAEDLNFVPKEA